MFNFVKKIKCCTNVDTIGIHVRSNMFGYKSISFLEYFDFSHFSQFYCIDSEAMYQSHFNHILLHLPCCDVSITFYPFDYSYEMN